MSTIDGNPPPATGAYDTPGSTEGTTPETGPSQPELDALWNLVMINATSIYQEAFAITQEAAEDDEAG